MEELKSLFGDESLSYAQLEQKLSEAGDTIKLVNLKSDKYVDRDIYEKQKSKLEKGLEDYKTKYEALQESTKGFDELKSQFDEVSTKYNELLGKQEVAEKMDKVKNANVNPKFVKFVYTEVASQMNDGDDFTTKLGEYLKENKEFLNTSKGTYVNLESGTIPPKSKNETMNDLIRRK